MKNHPIETKVAAGGIIGLLLALLTVYVPVIHAHLSPQLAATLPVILGALAAYMAPHTARPADNLTSATLLEQIGIVVDQLFQKYTRRPAPPASAAPAPAPAPAVAAPGPQPEPIPGGQP